MSGKAKLEPKSRTLFDFDDENRSEDVNPRSAEQHIDSRIFETSPPSKPMEEMLAAHHPEARQLFDLAKQIKELKPWRWMEESDLIGIVSPESDKIGFISVMGSIGEYEAVALYLGAEGLHGFIDMHENRDSSPDILLQVNHIQVAFSDRKDLETEDLNLIKTLGLKFRGTGAWPLFRTYRAGYLPWRITLDEARFFVHALSQIIELPVMVRDAEEQPFHPTGRVEEGGWLMRVSQKTPAGLVWRDQVWQIPKPKPESITVSIDSRLLESVKRIPRSDADFEVDLRLLPVRIGEPAERPVAAHALVTVDRDSGFLLGIELMNATDSVADMYSRVPGNLLNQLADHQFVPKRITVGSEKLRAVLQPLAQMLNVEVRYAKKLPNVNRALKEMNQWLQGGKH